jgi:hypothetical protein
VAKSQQHLGLASSPERLCEPWAEPGDFDGRIEIRGRDTGNGRFQEHVLESLSGGKPARRRVVGGRQESDGGRGLDQGALAGCCPLDVGELAGCRCGCRREQVRVISALWRVAGGDPIRA